MRKSVFVLVALFAASALMAQGPRAAEWLVRRGYGMSTGVVGDPQRPYQSVFNRIRHPEDKGPCPCWRIWVTEKSKTQSQICPL